MSRDDLRAHVEFFSELGVDGVRLEPEWRARACGANPSGPPGEPAGGVPTAAAAVGCQWLAPQIREYPTHHLFDPAQKLRQNPPRNYGSYITTTSSANYGRPVQNTAVAYQPRIMQLGFRVNF